MKIIRIFVLLVCPVIPLFAQAVRFELGMDTSSFPDLRNRVKNQSFFIALDSNNFEAYKNRALCYYQLAEYGLAIKDINSMLRQNPADANNYSSRGMCYVFLKDYPNALKDLNTALKLNPTDPVFYLNRAYAKAENKDYSSAITDLDQAIVLDPNYAKAFVNRGMAKKKMGKNEEAEQNYTKAIELKPTYIEAIINRAELRYLMAKYKDALADYNLALKTAPGIDGQDLFLHIADCYQKLGDNENYKVNYEKAMSLPKYDPATTPRVNVQTN